MKSRFLAVCIGLTVSVSTLAAGAANQPARCAKGRLEL